MKKLKDILSIIGFSKTVDILILTVIVAAVPVTVIILQKQQELRQQAAEFPSSSVNSVATVSLGLNPSTLTTFVGKDFETQLYLNAGSHTISSIDITVTFDKNILYMLAFSPTVFLNQPSTTRIDNKEGTLNFVAKNSSQNPITGLIDLGRITFRPMRVGTSVVGFSSVQITSTNQNEVLQNSGNTVGVYTIK